jgi:hypothetical protein
MRPVCVKCGKEMIPIHNGTIVYHPYEHEYFKPAQEQVGNVTVVNTDVLIEGSWKEGDIDFAVLGDTYECPKCKAQIVTGFGERMIDYQVKQEFLQKLVKKAIEGGYAVKILRKE